MIFSRYYFFLIYSHLVVDLDFIKSLAYYKIDVQSQMRKLFCEPCHIYVTSCLIQELKKQPEEEKEALFRVSKQLEVHYCHHPEGYSLSKCIVELTCL